VKLCDRLGTRVEIVEGLQAGVTIVAEGVEGLSSGIKVVRKEAK
jgi:hypothetical protein